MKEPPIQPEQAARWLMRQHLAAETTRVVTAVWWGVYPVAEALRELRGQAFLISERNKVPPEIADAVAVNAFDEEMQRQEDTHAASIHAMQDAALIELREGRGVKSARRAVAQIARELALAPTTYMMTHALERAAAQHRKAERWQAQEMAE